MKYYCFQHFLDVRNETETPTVALGKLSLLGSPIRHTVPPGFSCQAWVSSSLSLLHQQADSFPMHHLWSLCYKAPVMYCCCSVGKSCPTLCNPMDCSTLGSSLLHYLLEFAQIHIHWAGGTVYLIFCLLILLLTSIFSSITVFSNELAHKHQKLRDKEGVSRGSTALLTPWFWTSPKVAKNWSFNFSISHPMNIQG